MTLYNNMVPHISLVPQTPIREEKGSGNIMYELCQTQECGATNQIVISVTLHDFTHIIYRANFRAH